MVDKASKEARAKYVPAAAVTRTGRTLFGITGLKGYVTYALLRRLPLSVSHFTPKGSMKDFSRDLHA